MEPPIVSVIVPETSTLERRVTRSETLERAERTEKAKSESSLDAPPSSALRGLGTRLRSLGSAIGSAVGAVVSSTGLPIPGMGTQNVKKYAESGGGVGFGSPPVDWTISTGNIPVLDLGFVLSCWLDGLNVEAALAQLSKQPHTLPTQNMRILRNWITDNYRTFTSLEEFLEEAPGETFLEQVIWPLPLDVRLLLVEKYYGVDPIVMRQVLGKKLNSRTRKDMEDFCTRAILAPTLAEQRGADKIPPGRARRTFDNVRNIEKKMEDMRERGVFGPVNSGAVGFTGGVSTTDVVSPISPRTNTSFTTIPSEVIGDVVVEDDVSQDPISPSDHGLEEQGDKEQESSLADDDFQKVDDMPDVEDDKPPRPKGLQESISNTYLLPPKLAAVYTHVLFAIRHRFNHLTLPVKKRKLAHLKFNGIMAALKSMHEEWSDGWWNWDMGQQSNTEDLSRTMSNLSISPTTIPGLLPDLKDLLLVMKGWRNDVWEELRTKTVGKMTERDSNSIAISCLDRPGNDEPGTPTSLQPTLSQVALALPSALDPKSPQNTFKNLVRPPLAIASQLDRGSVEKEAFLDFFEKCVEPIQTLGWNLTDVDNFLDSLIESWNDLDLVSQKVKDRYKNSWKRMWKGYRGIVHGLWKSQ